jgi:hypothetical protein
MQIFQTVRGLCRRGAGDSEGSGFLVGSTSGTPSNIGARLGALLDLEDALLDEVDKSAHPSMYISEREWDSWWQDLPLRSPDSSPEACSQ